MKSKKILLIEDEIKISNMLKLMLQENGCQVEVAYDGKTGQELFKNQSYNFIFLDIMLPDTDGYEVCRNIRQMDKETPIIMISALDSLEDKIRGYEAGADDYIGKPFQFKEIFMKMNVFTNRNFGPSSQNILTAGTLKMNLDTKKVVRDEVVINLTAKEFQLLEYLIRNKNKVVSRKEIAMNVWDVDFDTNTNIIDVYISYIRNKVDKQFQHKLIQTQVGMGFILKETN